MLYVQQSLGANEELVHVGQFHSIYTVHSFSMIIWGIIGSVFVVCTALYGHEMLAQAFGSDLFPSFSRDMGVLERIRHVHPGIRIFAFIVFIYGLLRFAQMMVVKATTEIAVTNHRLIYKRGLVARHVGEISIDRIEGVNVLQSFWGRIFDYGRLVVHGMGVGEVVLPPIADPITFRRAIEKAKTI